MRSCRIWFVLLPLMANCFVSMRVADAGAGEIGKETEMQTAAAWCRALCPPDDSEETSANIDLIPAKPGPPFSFRYGSQESAGLLGEWRQSVKRRKLDERRTERTIDGTSTAGGGRAVP